MDCSHGKNVEILLWHIYDYDKLTSKLNKPQADTRDGDDIPTVFGIYAPSQIRMQRISVFNPSALQGVKECLLSLQARSILGKVSGEDDCANSASPLEVEITVLDSKCA